MKKLFAVSLGLFLVTLLFLGVYNFAFKNSPGNPVTDEAKQKEAKEKADKEFSENLRNEPIERVTEAAASGAIALDEKYIAFFSEKSLKKATLGGGAEEEIVGNLPGKLLRATWSPDRSAVLASLSVNGSPRWHLIRLEDRSATPLKDGLASPSWSNIGERIFYFYTDPANGRTGLNSAKPDGSEWKEIARSPVGNPYIATVPGGVNVSFWNRPNAFEETALYAVAMTGGEPKRIFDKKYGATYLWSPDGSKLLVSSVNEKGGSDIRLGIANQQGGEYHTLQAPTLVSKAVWSKDSQTIYYALPLSMPGNVVLPNDYFEKPINTKDSFWKMDTKTGKSDRIIALENISGEHDSIDLFLDPKEEFLFFTDRRDGRLYRIRL
jgi:Tol biopolymer transport system component